MHILFIDDRPDFKVQDAIDYLKANKVKFSYNICKSINSALRYFSEHISEIDLIVLDLGLPQFDGENSYGENYHKYGGLDIIDEIVLRKKIYSIPIIINSETKIEPTDGGTEKDFFSSYPPIILEHVEKIDGKWLLEFLHTNLKEKLELL